MGWTLLSVFLSGLLIILFRVFKRHNIGLLQTVVVNYWVCVLLGVSVTTGYFTQVVQMPTGAWLSAILQGGLFISMFILIGYASQTVGIAYTAMLTKMSVVIPALVSYLAFQDAMPWERWLGIALALFAVYLLHLPYLKKNNTDSKSLVTLSIALLIGTGLADTNLKIFQANYGTMVPEFVFTITLFGVAAAIGTLVFLIKWVLGKSKPRLINLVSGTIIGLPNYFSIIVILLALNQLDGTVFFPVNNVGQLIFISLTGVFLFAETYPVRSWLGLVLAVFSLLLISWRDLI